MSIENLSSQNAIEKIKELAKKESTCIFTTALTELPLAGAPMNTMDVDDDGVLWFFSNKNSTRNKNIEKDNRVQLFFSNSNNYQFLSLFGTAQVVINPAKAKDLWLPIVKAYFPGGVDDPDLSILKVTPHEAHYWDTKTNKLVALAKMVTGIFKGKIMNDGVEGELMV